MKMRLVKVLGLAAAFFCGNALAEGDVWEILPCDRNGVDITTRPVSSVAQPMPAGTNLYFKVRLAPQTGYHNWSLVPITPAATNSFVDPMGIGIYVSGKLTYAYRIGDIPSGQSGQITDVIFQYTVKPGDFALPIRLATIDGPAGQTFSEGLSYVFDPFGKWKYTSVHKTTGVALECNWWFCRPASPATRGETKRASTADYSLRDAGFYLKTIDFDNQWESPNTLWRSVHKGSTSTVGATPSLTTSSGPAEITTLYVWSTNEAAVKVVSDKKVTMRVGGTAAVPVMKEFSVAPVTFEAGQVVSEFKIQGVESNLTSHLVLSAYDRFKYSDSTDERDEDFISVPVSCVEPLPASLVVKPLKTTVVATADYLDYVTELSVALTEAYTNDLTVTLEPKFENVEAQAAHADWRDYIRVSGSPTMDVPDVCTNFTFTIPKGQLVPYESGSVRKIYLFALRGDKWSEGLRNHLQFEAYSADEVARKAIKGLDRTPQGQFNITAAAPVIVEPAEGATLSAVRNRPQKLFIRVSDTYADQISTNRGYKVYVWRNKTVDGDYTELDGEYAPGSNGYLYRLDTTTGKVLNSEPPTVTYSVEGDNESRVKVKSPVGEWSRESDSAGRKFTMVVTAPAGCTISVLNDQLIEDDGEHGGQGDVQLTVKLTQKNQTGSSIYAFLEPIDLASSNAVDCSFLATDGHMGLEIGDGSDEVAGFFMMIDGCTTASESLFKYRVVLRDAAAWEDGQEVTSYSKSNTLILKSSNVIPTITGALMGLNETDENGEFPGIQVPMGIPQSFAAIIDEPGLADLRMASPSNKMFQVQWKFSTTGQATRGPANGDAQGIIWGNPNEEAQYAKFTFQKAGRWTVTVNAKDKDMTSFKKEKLYTFYVDVVDKPTMSVVGWIGSGTEGVETQILNENESVDAGQTSDTAALKVRLSFNKCGFPMTVRLTVKPPTANPKDGILKLVTSSSVQEVSDDVYDLTFPAGVTEVEIPIKTLDGTTLSRSNGFSFTVENITDPQYVDPDSGEPVRSYYIANPNNKPLKVINVAPVVNPEWVYPPPGSTNQCAIGNGDTISWELSDVKPDFETPGKGIRIEIKAPNGEVRTITDATQTAGSFTPVFTTCGMQTVTIIFKDSDSGTLSYVWYYDVAVSKTVTMSASGPGSGNGSALSKKYRAAAGYGEGRVWASGDAGSATFLHTVNCGDAKTCRVFAYGYKVGDVDGDPAVFHYPDGVLPEGGSFGDNRDQHIAINQKGSSGAGGEYVYAGDKDSFLYAWLQVVRSTDSGTQVFTLVDTWLNGTIHPEFAAPSASTDSGTIVALPEELGNDGKYDETTLEAVFSKEMLWSDNMGDINQDGVPDVYYSKYWSDTVTTSDDGTTTGDDLLSLNAANDDGDYLPDYVAGWYTANDTNSLPAFSAVLEIRGYGDHLNDATAKTFPDGVINLCSVSGVEPARIYADPDTNPKSTLSKVEWLAWQEYAAANGLDEAETNDWSKWSPERPSDPTVADTDGDGFDDGLEYWFWYRAHVGYMDGDVHRYATGRRYNPAAPATGDLITREEIESLFDPQKPYVGDPKLRDTDNDGLSDLMEFLLGTNPIDFDTDGDGLPDGWEVCLAGTDPLYAYTGNLSISDNVRNYDGDAMAFAPMYCETNSMVLPVNQNPPQFTTFALVMPGAAENGKQWFAVRGTVDNATAVTAVTVQEPAQLVKVGEVDYLVLGDSIALVAGSRRLAKDYSYDRAFTVEKDADVAGTVCANLRLAPVHLPAGTVLAEDPVSLAEYQVATLVESLTKDTYEAWTYGVDVGFQTDTSEPLSTTGWGMRTLGRPTSAPKDVALAALPAVDDQFTLIHYEVYQEFGFDPRTAWNFNTPLSARWGSSENTYNKTKGGYAGIATRTRKFMAYDEFLLSSFFYHTCNGLLYWEDDIRSIDRTITFWNLYTTNPHGPNEPYVDVASESGESLWDTNGADTDKDGVPDGWELYVMGGPQATKGVFKFFTLYLLGDAAFSNFSPFEGLASDSGKTDNTAAGASSTAPGDGDGLTELQEFAGTDTTLYYASYSDTIKRPEEHKYWLNKFFPTDPWNADTDGDGIKDGSEIKTVNELVDGYIAYGYYCAKFLYGKPADDGSSVCFAGGGLNPCSVDTDKDGLPDPWEAQYAGTFDEANGLPDSKHGIVNGMDGTVPDAYTRPWLKIRTSYSDSDDTPDWINRDYDRDGLENWQEYLTGTMRCWRYDDPLSRWDGRPVSDYFTWNAANATWEFDIEKAKAATGLTTDDEFWYETLVNVSGAHYNPFLVMDQASGNAQYFTRVRNPFDIVYSDSGTYYFFPDGPDHALTDTGSDLFKAWIEKNAADPMSVDTDAIQVFPAAYMGTSPIDADTDHDGLDDYYELFHGMNPILGTPGVAYGSGKSCDLIYTVWSGKDKRALVKAWRSDVTEGLEDVNYWTSSRSPLSAKARGVGMDFTVYPWLNGLESADPDGDDLPNNEEGIRSANGQVNGRRTDPTPLWMTDSNYSNSLVRLFFRVPNRYAKIPLTATSFEAAGKTYYFRDYGSWAPGKASGEAGSFAAFTPDKWGVAASGHYNWAYSFEENEGYDTDHDGVNDMAELKEANGVTDPQDASSPKRRQAMYFPGNNSALQTLPLQEEIHPLGGRTYGKDEPTFRQFTVECWAYPESANTDAVLVERPVWVNESKAATGQDLVRKTFQIGIRGGRWYAQFDSTGTLKPSKVVADSGVAVTVGEWRHVAATYDGTALKIYIDGNQRNACAVDFAAGLWPAIARDAVRLSETNGLALAYDDFAFDKSYAYSCILIGAEMKTYADFPALGFYEQWVGHAIDITQGRGWSDYKNFFKGYIDEVRIWDGARSADQVRATMRSRLTAEDVEANRSEFYDAWKSYGSRYTATDPSLVPAELRHQFSFDSTFGADNTSAVAKAPTGFLDSEAAVLSRPDDWTCLWWDRIVKRFGSVYNETKWVTWIPDTVAHMPRFDETALDSFYWSKNFVGGKSQENDILVTAEPVSRWTQMIVNSSGSDAIYRTTPMRHQLTYSPMYFGEFGEASGYWRLFDFTGRNTCQFGADLLPLGGAYVKYCDQTVGMWDEQGASTNWEVQDLDSDGNGLPDWWETYAMQNYTDGSIAKLDWETIVTYEPTGVRMSAGEAYLRDLARGMFANTGHEADLGGGKYRQTYDQDGNGIPDWWEQMFGLSNAEALGDADNDGLPNYVEYLLSEVFSFKGVVFNPKKAKSVDPHTLDYFCPIGSLYVGEILTDHDLVDDLWEDQYGEGYASRLKYDAFADADNDGWCNRSEARYSKQCMPIIANRQSHYTVSESSNEGDKLMADYPIPTLDLTIRYNGVWEEAVKKSSIVVMTTTDDTLVDDADAKYVIEAATADTATSGESSTQKKNKNNSKTRYLGRWSNRHVVGTLTPGNISANSVQIECCDDPSSATYTWEYFTDNRWSMGRGKRADYDKARRSYGENNVILMSKNTAFSALDGVDMRTDTETGVATLIFTENGKSLGTVNTLTGEFDIDFGALAGVYLTTNRAESATNLATLVSAEDQTYRIAYSANPSAGLPRHLYLGEANTGYVREGKNQILVWADIPSTELAGATEGVWDAGEPFAILRDVDVSWRGTKLDIELTDTSPVFDRLKLDTGDSSRKFVFGKDGGTSESPNVATNSTMTFNLTSDLSGGLVNHIRVVPYLVRGTMQEASVKPEAQRDVFVFSLTTNRVVTSFDVNQNNGNVIHEGYFIKDGAFDIDWNDFGREILNNARIKSAVGDITAVTYRLVIGDKGEIGPISATDSATAVNALRTVIERRFEPTASRTKPTTVAPGEENNETVFDASPTFTWRLDEPTTGAGKFGCSYSAFNVQVKDASGALVYDSGLKRTPPANTDGSFSWKAPIYVGDMLPSGKVFANKTDYTWSVSMYNAKFRTSLYSNESRFRMQVQTNGYFVGTARVAVRYMGPAKSYEGKQVRVRAYESPDFTGVPVAGGYVSDKGTLAVTGAVLTANCTLVGMPVGTYYFQAWIDSNGNEVCDPWESSGYFCNRDGHAKEFLNPVGVNYGTEIGAGDLLEIYLEDADTDGDGLPDAWEYATYGGLNVKGVEMLSENGTEFLYKTETAIAEKLQVRGDVPTAGLASKALTALQTAGTLALALGIEPAGYSSFNAAITGAVSEELAEDGVSISSLRFVDGKVEIEVTGETTTKVDSTSPLAATLGASAGELAVTCYVSCSEDAVTWSDWTKVGVITVGTGAQTVDLTDVVPADKSSCFIKIKLEK